MAINWKVKMGKIGRLTFIRRLGITEGSIEYRNVDFKRFSCDDLAIHCVNIW